MYQNLASQPQNVPQSQYVPQPQFPQPQQQQMMYGSVEQQKRMKYKNVLYYLGMTEVIMGAISCLFCVASLVAASTSGGYPYYYGLTFVSQGLWCGGFLIASGILGLRARGNPSRCIYNANMGVAITASVFMGILVVMSSIAAFAPNMFVTICHILLALDGLAGMIVAIVHAAYCCAGVCCISNQYRGPVVYGQQQVPMQSMMQVQLANGQYMMVPYQPVMQPNVQPAQVSLGTPVVAAQMPTATTSAFPNVQPTQVPLGTPVVAAQMPTANTAVVPNVQPAQVPVGTPLLAAQVPTTTNPVPPAAPDGHAKPPDYSPYPHQQI